MNSKLLLPHKFKRLGWIILLISTLLWIYQEISGEKGLTFTTKVFAVIGENILGKTSMFKFVETDIVNTIIGSLVIIGGMMVGFSKEKNEDEFIASLRQTSLLWAVLVNYLLLLFMFLFIYGLSFLNVMLYNMFTVLLIYIIRFNFLIYRNIKKMSDEK